MTLLIIVHEIFYFTKINKQKYFIVQYLQVKKKKKNMFVETFVNSILYLIIHVIVIKICTIKNNRKNFFFV